MARAIGRDITPFFEGRQTFATGERHLHSAGARDVLHTLLVGPIIRHAPPRASVAVVKPSSSKPPLAYVLCLCYVVLYCVVLLCCVVLLLCSVC
jgi:hypothetical protein